ncbi:hypothetical protein [Gandjariella thermophila]|uniref:Uncharacterized protein n=1 Tax=Gandjariella thermophila TaxID=1931992 RepID=A0A4D4J3R9_9PSEU|nr:hypothetical protein [Gandjariella thermophila]GDY29146.1 hypothetical protein GTS_07790 [Gandjariella thermophila]
MTEKTNSKITIRLMADWETGPFWVAVGGGVAHPYGVEEITDVVPVDVGLLERVQVWDSRFQATYDDANPRDAGFATTEEQATFNAEGRELARQLREALPADIDVEYGPFGENGYEVIEASR